MRRLTARRALLLFAIIAPGIVTVVALLLAQWTFAAVAATVMITLLGTAQILALGEIRSLKRRADHHIKKTNHNGKLISLVRRDQQRLRALARESHGEAAAINLSVDSLAKATNATLERMEHAERRLVGIVESLRLEASDPSPFTTLQGSFRDGLKDLETAISHKTSSIANSTVTKTVSRLTSVARDETRQVEALLQLLPTIEPVAPLPSSGQWAMDARSLLHLSHLCRHLAPRNVVELGSGTSTIWLAYLLGGAGSIASIDHDPEWARLTQAALERHNLVEKVELRTAPLEPMSIASETFSWYGMDAVDGLSDIDLVLVDGPPKASGLLARYPALPALNDRLARRATIILDDADRPDEVRTIERWLAEFAGFRRIDEGVSRLAVLTRTM